jgi:glycosyltransferase involved in cell wall biosynthesis
MGLSKPKILIFIDWFLPGYRAGGPITSNANMIAYLKNDFEFYIVTRDTDYCENTPYSDITSDSWNKIEENVQVYYFSKAKLNYRNMKQVIRSLDFDIAYINGIYSLYFSILPLFLTKRKKQIVASRGMISAHALSVKSTKKKLFFMFARILNLYKKVCFHITTEEEDRYIKKIFGNNRNTFLAPNLPKLIDLSNVILIEKGKGSVKLVYIGRIAPEKNTLYAIELLAYTQGEISLELYGSVYDQTYWAECQDQINQLPDNVKVSYKGSVTGTELQQAYTRSHFLLLPTRGETFGHSILESFSYGRPVIISDQTPWRNLEEKEIGWDISLADKQKFIQAIEYCVDMDQETYDSMSNKTYNFAQQVIHDSDYVEQNKKLFQV